MHPVWSSIRYLVPLVSVVAWFMVKTLPLIVVVMGIIVSLAVFSVIHMLFAFMGSLKVVVMILSMGTFIAFLAGLPAIAWGGVLSVVKYL